MPVLACQKCNAKNRFDAVPQGQVPVCAQCGASLPWIHDGTDASFSSDTQASVPVIVDFWAPWCGPCRVMGPILEQVAQEMAGKVRIVKVNVDENRQSPAQFHVHGIPTLVMFKNGEAVDQIAGVVQKPALIARINHLNQIG